MNLQQLEYIVALDKHRHFQRAAEACGVSQPTLSALVQKLEEELDLTLFDRKSHPIAPTDSGRAVIDQARVILYNVAQLKEMTRSEKELESGTVRIGVIPTVAPYVLPRLFKQMQKDSPQIELRAFELRTAVIIEQLRKAELDMAILATPLEQPDFLEIPLYYEDVALGQYIINIYKCQIALGNNLCRVLLCGLCAGLALLAACKCQKCQCCDKNLSHSFIFFTVLQYLFIRFIRWFYSFTQRTWKPFALHADCLISNLLFTARVGVVRSKYRHTALPSGVVVEVQ